MLILAFALVWSLVAAAFHHHEDEPLAFHADCVYCLHQHNGSSAAFIVAAFALQPAAFPSPELALPTHLITDTQHRFYARAPPQIS